MRLKGSLCPSGRRFQAALVSEHDDERVFFGVLQCGPRERARARPSCLSHSHGCRRSPGAWCRNLGARRQSHQSERPAGKRKGAGRRSPASWGTLRRARCQSSERSRDWRPDTIGCTFVLKPGRRDTALSAGPLDRWKVNGGTSYVVKTPLVLLRTIIKFCKHPRV